MAREIVGEIRTEFERMSGNAQRADIYTEKGIRGLLKSNIFDYCNALMPRMRNPWEEVGFQMAQAILGTREYHERDRGKRLIELNNLMTRLEYLCENLDYEDLFPFHGDIKKNGVKNTLNKYEEKIAKPFGRAVIHVHAVKSEKESVMDEEEIPKYVTYPIAGEIVAYEVDEKEDTKK